MSELGAVIFVCRDKHMKEFDEVFVDKTKYGTKLKTSDYKECGKYPIIDQGQETIAGYTDAEDGVFKEVPVIIFGDHTRVIKYVDKPFFLGADGVKVLRSKYLDANYRYLFYALLNLKIPNTGYNRHFKWLKEAKIQYPTLKQQEKVVGILDKIEEVMAARNKQLNALEDLIQARFVEMFGEPSTNPRGWTETTVGDECFYIKDGPHKSMPDIGKENGGHPFISVRNIVNGYIDFSTARYISDEDFAEAIKKCHPEKGDILYSKGGTTGIAKFIDIDEEFANWVHVAVLKFDKSKLNGIFFENMLNGAYCYEQSQRLTKGIANRDLVLSAMAQIKMYRPPIELQNQFAAFVNQVHKSKVEIQQALEKTQLLFDSLMQQYFG